MKQLQLLGLILTLSAAPARCQNSLAWDLAVAPLNVFKKSIKNITGQKQTFVIQSKAYHAAIELSSVEQVGVAEDPKAGSFPFIVGIVQKGSLDAGDPMRGEHLNKGDKTLISLPENCAEIAKTSFNSGVPFTIAGEGSWSKGPKSSTGTEQIFFVEFKGKVQCSAVKS